MNMPVPSVALVLLAFALVLLMVHAAGRAVPLWIPVLLMLIIQMLQVIPGGGR